MDSFGSRFQIGYEVRDGDQVTEIVEQKDATPAQAEIAEINSGVYAFDAEVLADGLARLSTDNAQGELYLTDVLGGVALGVAIWSIIGTLALVAGYVRHNNRVA